MVAGLISAIICLWLVYLWPFAHRRGKCSNFDFSGLYCNLEFFVCLMHQRKWTVRACLFL